MPVDELDEDARVEPGELCADEVLARRVGLDECKSLLEQQNLVLLPQHLAPATSRQMFIRMLTNLYYISEQHDPPLSARISEWITAVRQS